MMIKEFIDECENFLINAVPVQPGSFPVVLSPIAAGVFAHESFAINQRRFYDRR